jgi:diguanylate cyclase (GGDEF)-like protein
MPSDRRLAAQVHRFAGVAAWFAIGVGLVVLTGWALGVAELTEIPHGSIAMKPNTAIGFLLAGAALWIVRDGPASPPRRALAAAAGAVIVVVAVLTLVEYAGDVDLGVDHLFRDTTGQSDNPGRPSPHTAVVFLFAGAWLTLLDPAGRAQRVAREWVSTLTCISVMQALIGYVFAVPYLYRSSGVTGVAPPTVGTMLVLSAGLLAARPTQSFMGLLTSSAAGGHLARRLVPVVVGVPLVAGVLRLEAGDAGLIDERAGVAIMAGTMMIATGVVLVLTCLSIDRGDAERRRLEEELQALAERDPLTNLFNRRRFDEQLERELALARRNGTRVALVMIDLDGLKPVNDTYGHRGGDALLLGLAETLTGHLRGTDVAARLGGDEFGVLLPDADPAGAEAAARRIVSAMHRTWTVGAMEIASTVSVGVAISGDPVPGAPELADAADRALYEAKRGGRDTFRIVRLGAGAAR